MKILLKTVNSYFISPCEGKYKQRCEKTKILIHETIGNKFLKHEKSGNKYPDSLNDAHVNILRKTADNSPVLILEDDVKWDGTMELEVPDDADAVYLGNSNRGNTLLKWSSLSKFDSQYYRVYSMRATHAILYISSRYKLAAANSIDTGGVVLDESLANIQKHFKIYTKDKPVFYQADTPNEEATRQSAGEIMTKSTLHHAIIIVPILLLFVFAVRKYYSKK